MMGTFQYPFDFAIRKELLFGNFIHGESNAALLHFLQNFVPSNERFCFLSGGRGSGKTHLQQALCQHSDNALYLPLAELKAWGPATLDGLDSLDLLVVDDLHLIAGDSAWEEKLFELFNAIHAGTGALCLSAETAPGAMPLELADLRSRLQACVHFDVQELDDAGKAQALKHNARQRGMKLKEEVAQYILLRSGRNMHELIAVLDRLDLLSLAEQRRLTIPFVKAAMQW